MPTIDQLRAQVPPAYRNHPEAFLRKNVHLLGVTQQAVQLTPGLLHGHDHGKVATPAKREGKRLRQKPGHEESKIQRAVITWWDFGGCQRWGLTPILLFAIPNGGRRDRVTGAILKSEGVRAGVSDLFLAVKRKGYGGLFIEMKAPKGRVSIAQDIFIREVDRQGYAAFACYSFDAAVKLITGYLNGEEFF